MQRNTDIGLFTKPSKISAIKTRKIMGGRYNIFKKNLREVKNYARGRI